MNVKPTESKKCRYSYPEARHTPLAKIETKEGKTLELTGDKEGIDILLNLLKKD